MEKRQGSKVRISHGGGISWVALSDLLSVDGVANPNLVGKGFGPAANTTPMVGKGFGPADNPTPMVGPKEKKKAPPSAAVENTLNPQAPSSAASFFLGAGKKEKGHENPKTRLNMAIPAIKGDPVEAGDMVYDTKWHPEQGGYISTLTISALAILGADSMYVSDLHLTSKEAEKCAARKALELNEERIAIAQEERKAGRCTSRHQRTLMIQAERKAAKQLDKEKREGKGEKGTGKSTQPMYDPSALGAAAAASPHVAALAAEALAARRSPAASPVAAAASPHVAALAAAALAARQPPAASPAPAAGPAKAAAPAYQPQPIFGTTSTAAYNPAIPRPNPQ